MVSVLMTSYNREKYIRESIDSILRQDYKDFELIIVDDASTDSTWDIINEYTLRDKRVKAYRNSKNLGDYPNRNQAANYATGEFIKYLDSDDIMSSNCLSEMVSKMDSYPNAALGLISLFDDTLHIYKECLSPNELYQQFYFKGNLINCCPSRIIIRRKYFEILGRFHSDQYLSDTTFLLRACAKYDAVIFSKELIYWREHLEQEYLLAKKNNWYERYRFSYMMNHLMHDACPLLNIEKKMAIRNIKNRYARKFLFSLLKFDFKNAILIFNQCGFNIFDILVSFRRNSYPKII